jgi:hypothetical protein
MVVGITTGTAVGPAIAASGVLTPNIDAYLLGANLFGNVLQAYGQYQAAEAAAETMEYNATIAERDALQVAEATEFELHKARTTQRKLLARQIAATAASGRQMSGSPLDVMARAESEALMDQAIIRSNSATARGKLHAQSSYDRMRADVTRDAGRAKAFTSLMSSTSKSYAQSNYFKKRGE